MEPQVDQSEVVVAVVVAVVATAVVVDVFCSVSLTTII